MDIAADYAFALAYQWWLNCDAYFANALRSGKVLNGDWVRKIGFVYLVNRSIRKNREDSFASCIRESGQINGMPLPERAKLLSCALTKWVGEERRHPNAQGRIVFPLSAASKISWFVWPCGWTMYDGLASQAVLGAKTATDSVDRMESFYSTLSKNGWNEVLRDVRLDIAECNMDERLAERTLDKHLFLLGLPMDRRTEQEQQLEAFLSALPKQAQDEARCIGRKVGVHLRSARLGTAH
ncbi:hypothetical protein [Pelagibacterium xiamenense]|uniref:hypothetical protein n=1 Tax=Pelagibacterium xiamenense TaxID=2901140 RepID=UPI001E592215|nr:hypothetical protein [Pelagibacterium xiamenense]MCD7061122.1 hypothetical protein [Pelagibacterium xiamenense]